MGREDADELMIRAQIGHAVRMILKEKACKQREISELLGIGQAEVSKLVNGKYHLFSEGRLLGFLNRLDQKIILRIEPRQKDERALEVI